ncbi:hypothetical protein VIGAN_01271700 [Vigna angularis var. angularis]|uniref:Uncharacterized protein n=1 Tax=Vigna angularis var. angularis TaxID=157739 RepID=A0A0S3R302_PHAAN|nr:hypothetical protein VIGAN_01271700 [Vigna angularis var. angularis]
MLFKIGLPHYLFLLYQVYELLGWTLEEKTKKRYWICLFLGQEIYAERTWLTIPWFNGFPSLRFGCWCCFSYPTNRTVDMYCITFSPTFTFDTQDRTTYYWVR